MLTADGSAVERLMRYFRYWAHTQGSDLPGGKCLVVTLGPEVCDLSEDMRGVLETGTDAIIKRITQCIEQGQLAGSVQAETPADALPPPLSQLCLEASTLSPPTN